MDKDEIIINELNKTKLTYAVSLIDRLVMSKDLNKINNDLHNVWRISGFKSREKFETLFKSYKGYSLGDYCKKLNPNCNC